MRAVLNQLICKPFPSDEETEGGLFVPLSARKVSNKMRVVSAGSGTKAKPMEFKEGDVIFRVDGWGTEIEIDGEKHYIFDTSSVLAKQ